MRAGRSCLPARARPRGAYSRRPCRCTPSSQAGAGSPRGPDGPTGLARFACSACPYDCQVWPSTPGCRIAPERVVGRLEAFDRVDVVQQSGEPRTLVGLLPSVVCLRARFPCHSPASDLRDMRAARAFPLACRLPSTTSAAAGTCTRGLVRQLLAVLRSSPTSRARGSSSYALGLHDALCPRRFPAPCRRTRDLPVPERDVSARARGL